MSELTSLGTALTAFRAVAEEDFVLNRIVAAASESDLEREEVFFWLEVCRLSQRREGRASGVDLPLLCLLLALAVSQKRGSTLLTLARLEEFLRELFSADPSLDATGLAAEVRERVAAHSLPADLFTWTGDERKPFLFGEGWLASQRYFVTEKRFVDRLSQLVGVPPESRWLSEYSEVFTLGSLKLNEEQQQAVRMALNHRFLLISGGPGTGKTSIVVALLRAIVRSGSSPSGIALAAPTGKAANRMDESLESRLAALAVAQNSADQQLAAAPPRATTLHRLLGYSPARDMFLHHRRNPLPFEWVIVDEGSMVDLFLMERLVSALDPCARLVLLGDADQLPAVAAGNVLQDLSGSTEFAARLETSYRMRADDPAGRNILMVARAIRDGREDDVFAAPSGECVTLGADVRQGVGLAPFEDLPRLVERWVAALPGRLAQTTIELRNGQPVSVDVLEQIFRAYEAQKILCATRVLATGSEEVNVMARKVFRRLFAQRRIDDVQKFFPGEPVMVVRNDYNKDIFNGDQGIVLRVRHDGQPGLAVGIRRAGGFVFHPLGVVQEEIESAFAMTVHKSQGSEYERILVVLPDDGDESEKPGGPGRVCSRELLYTALTRAKKLAVLVGTEAAVRLAVCSPTRRESGVKMRFFNT